MSDYLIISTSLNPESRSRIMALQASKAMQEAQKGQKDLVEYIDLRDFPLPLCDGDSAYGDANVGILTKKIAKAKAILLAIPIYNYSFSASVKNLIELTGQAWNEKIVGFLCAAGGRSSYMSIMSLANSLMLDFRCLINPRFVYTEGSAFKADLIHDPEIISRIEELAKSTINLIENIKIVGAD